jgi:hypothetical protein
VHRQTSMSAIQHMALGVYGFGCEDALIHLLNHVWPNVFETSPHVVQAFMGAIEGMRVGIGPSKVLQYALQVSSCKTDLIYYPPPGSGEGDIGMVFVRLSIRPSFRLCMHAHFVSGP